MIRLMRGLWILSLIGCAHSGAIETVESAPSPGIHLTSRVVRYAVRGADIHQLRAEMRRIGPIDDGGHQFAHTWGNYAWRFPYDKTADGCRTGPVSVELEIVQTYPEWVSRSGASTVTAREWSRWFAATEVHEDGHRKILLSVAQQAIEKISAVAAQPTCDELDRVANGQGAEVLRDGRAQHAAYDRETTHGAKSGARLRDDLP